MTKTKASEGETWMGANDPIKKQKQKQYQQLAKQHQPRPPMLRNLIWAFVVSGTIALVGQLINNFYLSLGMSKAHAGGAMAVTMVFLAGLVTGLGWYDRLGRLGGAGAAIPITGFANSIVSSAMEYKYEGLILGMSAKMFNIAGPVIVYGVTSAVIVGVLEWLVRGMPR